MLCGCGILLLTSIGCDSGTIAPPPAAKEQLNIVFPEGTDAQADNGPAQAAASLSLEGLTQLAIDGRVQPRLATSWSWSPDRLTLHVVLQKGVKLHDGRALDAAMAADILRGLIAGERTRMAFPALADVTHVKAESELGIAISLARRSSLLPEDLSVALAIGSGDQRIGTGPYRVSRKEENNVFHLERFDEYYRGTPAIARVVVRPVETLRIAWASLLRGEADMVTDLPPETIELIENDTVRIMSFPRRYQYLIAFNSRLPQLADPRVRRALNMAIDRERLVKGILNGAGSSATGPVWPRNWAYPANARRFEFDPAGAVKLLESAGLHLRQSDDPRLPPARLRLTCLVPEGFSVLEKIGLEVYRQLSEIGVDIRFDVRPLNEVENLVVDEAKFESVLMDMSSGPGLSRASVFWRSPSHPVAFRYFGYRNPETEALFERMKAAVTESEIRSVTEELHNAFLANPPAIFLAWTDRARAVRNDFAAVVTPETDPLPQIWQWGVPGSANAQDP